MAGRDHVLAGRGPGCQHVRVGLDENKALVRRYYDEVLTGRNRELLDQLVDPSFVSHISGGADAGVGAYAAAVEATLAAFADLVVTVHDQVAEEDKVPAKPVSPPAIPPPRRPMVRH